MCGMARRFAGFGVLVLCIKPTSSLPVLQTPISHAARAITSRLDSRSASLVVIDNCLRSKRAPLRVNEEFLSASQGLNLALNIFYVPDSLDSGIYTAHPPGSGLDCLICTLQDPALTVIYHIRGGRAV